MVQYKTFKLGLAETSGERLNSFLRQNTILSIEKQFVAAGAESFYSFLVEYDLQTPESKYDRKDRVDYAKTLTEKQFACFNELREFRNKCAKEQGLPPYVVFTNEMAEHMVRMENPSKAALSAVEGFGESKMAKYGDSILSILDRYTSRSKIDETRR